MHTSTSILWLFIAPLAPQINFILFDAGAFFYSARQMMLTAKQMKGMESECESERRRLQEKEL